MTDLVKRLRQHWKYEGSLLHEAADEIEKLENHIAFISLDIETIKQAVIDDMRAWNNRRWAKVIKGSENDVRSEHFDTDIDAYEKDSNASET